MEVSAIAPAKSTKATNASARKADAPADIFASLFSEISSGDTVHSKSHKRNSMKDSKVSDHAPEGKKKMDAAEDSASPLHAAVIPYILVETHGSQAEDNSAEIVSILEGNQLSKDLNPLLQSTNGSNAAVADNATDAGAAEQEAIEDTARMPRNNDPSELSKSSDVQEASTGALCPLENEGDDTEKDTISTEEKKLPAASEDGNLSPAQHNTSITAEKIAAKEQLGAMPETEPVSRENLFEALIERIEHTVSENSNQIEIHLKPDFLGKVSVHLSLGEGGLIAKIQSDDVNVKSMISAQVTTLMESLAQKGIEVAEVNVIYTGITEQSLSHPQGGSGQPQHNTSGRSGTEGISRDILSNSIPTWDEVTESIIDTTVSSVEYRA